MAIHGQHRIRLIVRLTKTARVAVFYFPPAKGNLVGSRNTVIARNEMTKQSSEYNGAPMAQLY